MAQRFQKVAAVCCSPGANGCVMFLLVRSSSGSKWTFPKGTVDPVDASPLAAVAREALEEAGITGEADPQPLGTYRKEVPARKMMDQGEEETVEAYLYVFTGTRSIGEPGRRPTWFTHERAAEAFRGNPGEALYANALCRLLDAARDRLLSLASASAAASSKSPDSSAAS